VKIYTVLSSKSLLIKAIFVFTIMTTILSCKKNETFEKAPDNEVFSNNNSEEIDAYFLIATANISKAIISKSQIAQQKCQDKRIKSLSSKIETNQNELLHEITKMANQKLIVILNTDEKESNDDLYSLIDATKANFDKAYIDLIIESISDQIELLKSITRETNDTDIIKLSIKYLPTQYRFLDESKALRKE
jgi:predicted outer membrane protein